MQAKPVSNTNLLALPEGTELVGDYRIKRVLGAGGFGITYLADEGALARLVTIKEYFPADFAARQGGGASPRSLDCAEDYNWGLERFLEEAQTLARFDHPNIVRVHRYFRANNTGYMVLHFEEGGSFKSWLKGLQRAPRQAELDNIVAPLLDALEIIHKANFLHRDIAPDNIIIRKDGSPVLIDFGSARGEIASHSKTVSALVKPGYSPYEQYATTSRQQGPWTDIYALGATLYHAVTGRRPPDAPSRMVNDEYAPAREGALSSFRASFLGAVDKALRLEVGERPQSIADWRGLLLAPAPKREPGRLGLRLPLARTFGRKSAASPSPAPTSDAPTVALTDKPASMVPAPPDAPQPKGQLLDFIEALKKHRPVLTPKKKAPAEPQRAAMAAPPPPRQSAEPQFGLGYGPPPVQPVAPPARSSVPLPPIPAKALPRVLQPVTTERRAKPRPRRVGAWRATSMRWRSLAFKLLIGVGIASLAVAYQDKVPRFEGRGAAVVSSQATDLAQAARIPGHRGAVVAVATGDQGRWIVSAGNDATLKVWNAGSAAPVRALELDEGAATALAVDERRALTGHKGGAIVLWDLERAERIGTFQHGNAPVTSLAFTGESTFAAAAQDGSVSLFDKRAPSTPAALLDGQESAGQIIAASRTATFLATGGDDRTVRLFETESRNLARSWRGRTGVTALDIAPGGRTVAGGGADGMIRLWSASASRQQRALKAHEGRVTALAFAPKERLLASAGEDGQVKLWDLRSGKSPRTFRGHAGPVRAVSFSADGRRLVSGGQDGAIRVWSIAGAPATN